MPIAASSRTTTPRLAATAPAIRCGIRMSAVTCSSGIAVVTGRLGFSSRTSARTWGIMPPLVDFTSSDTRRHVSLRDRHVDERTDLGAERIHLRIRRNPDDRERRLRIAHDLRFELAAQHVGRPPDATRHRLVDDDRAGRRRGVLFGEVAAADQAAYSAS